MKIARNHIKLILFIIISVNLSLSSQELGGKLLPSEALTLMMNAVEKNPDKKRIEATLPYQSRIITEGLSKEEKFYLGETYFWNYKPLEAKEIYSYFFDGHDKYARAAWQRTMQINFGAFEKYDVVEKLIPEFRRKFKNDIRDQLYLFEQVNNYARRYAEKGNHEKAIQLIEEELNSLDYKGPYRSVLLPAYHFNSFKELKKEKLAFDLLNHAKEKLKLTVEERKKNMPKVDVDYLLYSDRVNYMETIITHSMGYNQLTLKIQKLVDSIDKAIAHFSSTEKN